MGATPKDRLNQYLNAKHLSLSKFATQCGVDKGVISRFGETTSKTTLHKISSNSDVNVDWLITGKGTMFQKELGGNARLVGIDAASPIIEVRYFEVSPSATFQEFMSDVPETASRIGIPNIPGLIIDDSYCVFQISGDSMSPRIVNHARILCQEVVPSKWHTLREGVVVIAYADKFVVKRIVRNELDTANRIILASDNPDYPEQHTVAESEIHSMFRTVSIVYSPIN